MNSGRRSICTGLLAGGTVLMCRTLCADEEPDAESNKPFDFSMADVADRLVNITCSSSNEKWFGSGFIAEMDGAHYIFTNQHLILGADKINFNTQDHQALRPRKIEFSDTRNLVRLAVDTDQAFKLTTNANMDDPVAVFGNAEGKPSDFYGKINGVGADLVETTAEFTREHGGAPVINADGEVIGIASSVRESRDHAMKEGTKFENRTRRFCQRLTGVRWQAVNWKRYNEAFGKLYRQNEQLIENTFDILVDWNQAPFKTISLQDSSDRNFSSWVKSHNATMKKIAGSANKRSKYSAYSESLEELTEVCDSRARQLHLLVERKELTGFLRNEFDAQASAFEFACKYIKRRGDTIHTFRD